MTLIKADLGIVNYKTDKKILIVYLEKRNN